LAIFLATGVHTVPFLLSDQGAAIAVNVAVTVIVVTTVGVIVVIAIVVVVVVMAGDEDRVLILFFFLGSTHDHIACIFLLWPALTMTILISQHWRRCVDLVWAKRLHLQAHNPDDWQQG
jgi:hypothetical protein